MSKQSIENLISYKKGFATVRTLGIVVIIGSLLFCSLVYLDSSSKLSNSKNEIFLIDKDGGIGTASKTEMSKEVRAFEYTDHIVIATTLINQYDEGTLDDNLERASYFFGDCFEDIVSLFESKDIKQKLQQNNVYTTVKIEADSVVLNLESTPISGVVRYTQVYKKPGVLNSNKVFNEVEFELEEFSRSSKNSHGVKITSWQLVNSYTIKK